MVIVTELMKGELICVSSGTSAAEAARLMREHRIGSVFVRTHADIVGIVTESDLVRKVVGAEREAGSVRVDDIMSTPVLGIEGRRPITEAADLMEQHRTRHLAVTRSGAIVGVLSVRDLLRPVSMDDF